MEVGGRGVGARSEGGSDLGALNGGVLMSHVNRKKWQCHMSLSLIR